MRLRNHRRCEDCGAEVDPRRPRARCRFCRRWLCLTCWTRKHAPIPPGDLCVAQAATSSQVALFDQDAEG